VATGTGGSTSILLYGDGRLRQSCRPVEPGEEDCQQLAADLWRLMIQAGGIGLSAPQVGDLRQLIVVKDPRRSIPPRRMVLINPELLETSSTEISFEEGCLSFPQIYLPIVRPAHIRLKYRNLVGREKEMLANGLLGRIILHELDHLDGRLFIDHLSLLRRWFLSWRLKKLTRGNREDVG
jgi:peptide deformylase